MKNGTPTRRKYLLPYREKWKKIFGNPPEVLTPKAEMRLRWMDYIDEGNSVNKASRHFDIPEPTIRYWRERYNPYNLQSLEDKSKRPKNVRLCELDIEVVQRVIDLRTKYHWGKVKLQVLLNREGINIGQTRIQKIINTTGLKRIPASKRKYIQRKNRRHMYAVPRDVMKQPGGLVYLDVKHLTLPGGLKAYQFMGIDHATRMMRAKVYARITSLSGKEFLDYLKQEFPFEHIQYIGSDNGSEFLGLFDKELELRGIQHVFSSPRSPKQNPFVERVIQTVIKEVYEYDGLEATRERQQEVLDNYVTVYNEIRPHHSLGLKTPMEQYIILSTPNS